ncbi:GtrA family protein [Pseudomonas sp. N040]|uniref:GtrA family protein n=1 Tax=Pseudomonas sp. N040 TaxID=2785325 RepID=UPI0018A33784|nr:GtrA family protein [Pseudomonas sp. N040]MBF7728990.1 GtrA family protein [Pseudomonas sp. N040]MBW7012630.1 GtrA family protein [Pseudomonas sp. N040]
MRSHAWEVLRYGVNGVVATAVHFSVLAFNLQVLHFSSAGLANLVAALFGITTSFFGSRYFVFPRTGETIVVEALRFSSLYGFIALLHGGVLLVWTDHFGLDYRLGFLLATVLQVSLSYLGNKFLVFKL